MVADNKRFLELKRSISDHVACIQDVLRTFQPVESRRESVADQLEDLIKRVRVIEAEAAKNRDLLEAERHKSNHDTLTGLPNRASYSERAFHELRRYKRYHRPLTLAVCDIDYFKKINDLYGHQAGDKALKIIAKVIFTRLRSVDFIARLGGEEFVLLMPETTADQAVSVLDKVRVAVGKIPFRFNSKRLNITISFGISEFKPEDSMEAVFQRADKALYFAKTHGRNRCCIERKERSLENSNSRSKLAVAK